MRREDSDALPGCERFPTFFFGSTLRTKDAGCGTNFRSMEDNDDRYAMHTRKGRRVNQHGRGSPAFIILHVDLDK